MDALPYSSTDRLRDTPSASFFSKNMAQLSPAAFPLPGSDGSHLQSSALVCHVFSWPWKPPGLRFASCVARRTACSPSKLLQNSYRFSHSSCPFYRHQAVAHQQILISLCFNFRLQLFRCHPVKAASAYFLARACFAAVGNILYGVIQPAEAPPLPEVRRPLQNQFTSNAPLFSSSGVSGVKRAIMAFFLSPALVHMGHKIITAAFQSGPAQIFFLMMSSHWGAYMAVSINFCSFDPGALQQFSQLPGIPHLQGPAVLKQVA